MPFKRVKSERHPICLFKIIITLNLLSTLWPYPLGHELGELTGHRCAMVVTDCLELSFQFWIRSEDDDVWRWIHIFSVLVGYIRRVFRSFCVSAEMPKDPFWGTLPVVFLHRCGRVTTSIFVDSFTDPPSHIVQGFGWFEELRIVFFDHCCRGSCVSCDIEDRSPLL